MQIHHETRELDDAREWLILGRDAVLHAHRAIVEDPDALEGLGDLEILRHRRGPRGHRGLKDFGGSSGLIRLRATILPYQPAHGLWVHRTHPAHRVLAAEAILLEPEGILTLFASLVRVEVQPKLDFPSVLRVRGSVRFQYGLVPFCSWRQLYALVMGTEIACS